jgi:hypothetical protein
MQCNYLRRGLCFATIAGALTLAACGGDSGGGGTSSFSAPIGPPPITSPGSGLFAVDCNTQRAYVPLDKLDTATGNGQVAVIDLTADPDTKNPVKTVVV